MKAVLKYNILSHPSTSQQLFSSLQLHSYNDIHPPRRSNQHSCTSCPYRQYIPSVAVHHKSQNVTQALRRESTAARDNQLINVCPTAPKEPAVVAPEDAVKSKQDAVSIERLPPRLRKTLGGSSSSRSIQYTPFPRSHNLPVKLRKLQIQREVETEPAARDQGPEPADSSSKQLAPGDLHNPPEPGHSKILTFNSLVRRATTKGKKCRKGKRTQAAKKNTKKEKAEQGDIKEGAPSAVEPKSQTVVSLVSPVRLTIPTVFFT